METETHMQPIIAPFRSPSRVCRIGLEHGEVRCRQNAARMSHRAVFVCIPITTGKHVGQYKIIQNDIALHIVI